MFIRFFYLIWFDLIFFLCLFFIAFFYPPKSSRALGVCVCASFSALILLHFATFWFGAFFEVLCVCALVYASHLWQSHRSWLHFVCFFSISSVQNILTKLKKIPNDWIAKWKAIYRTQYLCALHMHRKRMRAKKRPLLAAMWNNAYKRILPSISK